VDEGRPEGAPNYWFGPKRYGVGWGWPLTWEGWLTLAVAVAVATLAVIWLGADSNFGIAVFVIDAVAFLGICLWKGAPLSVRWGDDDPPSEGTGSGRDLPDRW
jgi:hypothetical protein